MVRLEMDRIVEDGIKLEDCDVVVLGAKVVFSKIKTVNGEQQFKVYKRDEFSARSICSSPSFRSTETSTS